MAEICVNAAFELSIHIGQHVRHGEYKGQRVTGVVQGLFVQGRELMAEIVLDAPIVIPPHVEGESPISIYRQHVPAHELAPFDERDELIAELVARLQLIERLSSEADGSLVDVRAMLGDLARTAIAKAAGAAS